MASPTRIRQVQQSLFWIELQVPIPGFESFIGAWVYTGHPVLIVDVGPAVSATHLLSALAELQIGKPDLILLTHIHIDHAGAIGAVARAFPFAPVVCHPKGLAHLTDPERLWQGSLQTLGPIARTYGPIQPVPAKQLLPADQLSLPEVAAVDSPGHAPHHYSYLTNDGLLFAGEAGGVSLPLPDGTFYSRPATPPQFHMETALDSIDRLIAHGPRWMCYGHCGMRPGAVALLTEHRHQILRWLGLIRPWFATAGNDSANAIETCSEDLLIKDPLVSGFCQLPPLVQRRERTFLHNSIRGFWGYLAKG